MKSTTIVALALVSVSPSAELPKDVFIRDRVLSSDQGLERLTTNLILGRSNAAANLEAALHESGDGQLEERLSAYLHLCGSYFREQRYADGVRACSTAERMRVGSAKSLLDLHQLLLPIGRMSWSTPSVRIPLDPDHMTTAERGAARVQVLIDSGAEIAVLSPSAARALNAQPLGSSVTLGTTTAQVAGSLVRVDAIRVGNSTLSNIVCFVLSEEQARYAGISLILPLRTITALGRAAYTDNGRVLLLGKSAPRIGSASAPLYWDESGLGFGIAFRNGLRGVHLDTGSDRTWLFPAALAVLSASEVTSRLPYRRTIGGLGGERVEDASVFSGVGLSIGGKYWHFDRIEMAAEDLHGEAARIGTNLFQRFTTVLLDFEGMRISVED